MAYTFVLLLLSLIAALAVFLLWKAIRSRHQAVGRCAALDDGTIASSDPYQDIKPLHHFDWSSTKPLQIRPFKPRFHLTMGLVNCPLSEYIEIDSTYLERIRLRKSLMDEHGIETYQCHPTCEAAVMEMYEWTFGIYLPRRFPTVYKVVHSKQLLDSKANNSWLYDLPANEYIPLRASSTDDALYNLGKHVDTDILILLPSSTAADGSPIYHLEAYVCCFPSGFSLPQKFRLPLASIHEPVPGYKAKLEKSMDRYFAKLETGKAVKRVNWSITTNTKLFSGDGNHLYADGTTGPANDTNQKTLKRPTASEHESPLEVDSADLEATIEEQKKQVEIDDCVLRCERQTLHRLPKTKAVVFSFKTYQYKLADVKAEGNGPALAEAISGLSKGNSPDINFYKRGVVWGDKVREYLLS